ENAAGTAAVYGTVVRYVLNVTLATTALQFSNVGTYPITVTLGSNPNYSVTPFNGTLTITPKAATVTADDKSKIYGSVNPALTAKIGRTASREIVKISLTAAALK